MNSSDSIRLNIVFITALVLNLIIISPIVRADAPQLKETIADTGCIIPVNNTISLNVGDLDLLAKYRTYEIFEVGGNLLHRIERTYYYQWPFEVKYCREFRSTENMRVFDLYIYKNDVEILFEPYVDFSILNNETGEKKASIPCYTFKQNDTIVLDYYMGDKIYPIEEKIIFFNITLSEFFYPLDKYYFTAWSSLDNVYYNRIDKVVLPSSFIIDEEKSTNVCPSAMKVGFYIPRFNEKTNQTEKVRSFDMSLLGSDTSYEAGGKSDYIDYENRRIIIWPTITSAPLDFVKDYYSAIYNLSPNDWDKIRDERTGCFLYVTFQRTDIVKYFFFIAFALIILSTIYFLYFWDEKSQMKGKIYKVFSFTFLIWSFQEGLNSLTPLIRPTTVTIFDLTIFLPLISIPLTMIAKKTIHKIIRLFKINKKNNVDVFISYAS